MSIYQNIFSRSLTLYKKTIALHIKWKILIVAIAFINISAGYTAIFLAQYRNLVWLFYYSFFSNSPVSWITPLLPQEPAILMATIIYNPLLVALVAGIATFIIEMLNYWALVPICNLERLKPFKEKRFYKILVKYYNKFPFVVVTFVGLTPVPHTPFRFLAVLAGYPVLKFSFATFLGRTSFYYVLALIGKNLNLPYWIYILLILLLVLMGFIRWLYQRLLPGKFNSTPE